MEAIVPVHLDIVSNEGQIFSGLVEMVSISGTLGELGILRGHTPLLSSIKPGEVRLNLPGNKKGVFYISGGMLEVQPTVITILADTMIRAESLDEAAAIAAKKHAETLLTERKANVNYTQALLEIAKAAAQIRAIKTNRGVNH
jgi:F-type H+-transporting ATPase subunit epsilon